MAKKKVLGISFGRKMSNCDIMVKHALMECEKEGCEVAFLRADDLEINNCTGCIACVIGMMSGRGRGYCVKHDDFDILDECVMQSDAVILACPTYETSVTGRFKTICDRIGPSHDITFRKGAYDEGKEAGKAEADLPDARSFKKRSAALISVGGAMTENWIALTLPMMYEFTFPMAIDVVDTVEYYGAMAHESVLGYPEMMDRMTKVGQNIVASINAETEEEMDRSRLRWNGKLEHSTEIKTQAQPSGTIKNLKELKAPYAEFERNAFAPDTEAFGNIK